MPSNTFPLTAMEKMASLPSPHIAARLPNSSAKFQPRHLNLALGPVSREVNWNSLLIWEKLSVHPGLTIF